jgi:hypothetical protein
MDPITVISPNGGDSFTIGSTMEIQWQGDPERVTAVVIELSPDDGENWVTISGSASIEAFPDGGTTGSFLFVVPQTLLGGPVESERCLIRVTDYTETSFSDESDAHFTISNELPVANLPFNAAGAHRPSVITIQGVPWVRTPGGAHVVWVYSLSGQTIARYDGAGPALYPLSSGVPLSSTHIVRVRYRDGEWAGKVVSR